MATTLTRIDILALGLRDSSGNVVNGGKVRFYNPGTLVAATVYQDATGSTPFSQPVTLNSVGQATVYTLAAVRMIAKDSTETTTYYDDVVNLVRERTVYVTHPDFNAGAETNLYSVLTTIAAATDADSQNYKESASATTRVLSEWLGELVVSIKDFGAVGDDSTDDTSAIQAAHDRVADGRAGGIILIPKGTYKITSAITCDTANVRWLGTAPGASIIKNYSTSANAFTVNLGSAIDSKIIMEAFTITASTTSSGTAIAVTNGDKVTVRNVRTALHRVGIDVSGVNDARVHDCHVASNDGNAAAIGIKGGVRSRITQCTSTHTSTAGTGFSLAGARATASDCYVTGMTTGFSWAAANTRVLDSEAFSCTTGFSVGAFADCISRGNTGSGNTTDISVNASATGFQDSSYWATVSTSGALRGISNMWGTPYVETSSSSSPTFTPVLTQGRRLQVFDCTSASSSTFTIAAPASTAMLQVGEVVWFVLCKSGANSVTAITWNAIYAGAQSFNAIATQPSTITANSATWVAFWWNGTEFRSLASDQTLAA